jgi:hypothetical protein
VTDLAAHEVNAILSGLTSEQRQELEGRRKTYNDNADGFLTKRMSRSGYLAFFLRNAGFYLGPDARPLWEAMRRVQEAYRLAAEDEDLVDPEAPDLDLGLPEEARNESPEGPDPGPEEGPGSDPEEHRRAPGRPTSQQRVLDELLRRWREGLMDPSGVGAEARTLSRWLADNHANEPQMGSNRTETVIRETYRELRETPISR